MMDFLTDLVFAAVMGKHPVAHVTGIVTRCILMIEDAIVLASYENQVWF